MASTSSDSRTRARSAPTTIDALVDATPATRDRYVDLLRAVSIGVVVLWHWVFSITHRNSAGALTMPNPIDGIPVGWLLTWVLQIMPLFFFVGGFANLVSWRASRRDGKGGGSFLRSRLSRLMKPLAVFVAIWLSVDTLLRMTWDGYHSVFEVALVVFIPLWFLAVYAFVVLTVPVTARWHDARPGLALAGIGLCVAAVDGARFAFGVVGIGWLNSVLVFLFAHQLGYWYGDGTLVRGGRRVALLLVGLGAATLVLLTTVGPYPGTLVATPRAEFSNMNPPTAAIATAAILQAGVVLLLRPAALVWLAHRRVWKAVVAANVFPMTIFLWHMTALFITLPLIGALVGGLSPEATTRWWVQRPLWLVLPGVVLAGLVAVFARFERPGERRKRGLWRRCSRAGAPLP